MWSFDVNLLDQSHERDLISSGISRELSSGVRFLRYRLERDLWYHRMDGYLLKGTGVIFPFWDIIAGEVSRDSLEELFEMLPRARSFDILSSEISFKRYWSSGYLERCRLGQSLERDLLIYSFEGYHLLDLSRAIVSNEFFITSRARSLDIISSGSWVLNGFSQEISSRAKSREGSLSYSNGATALPSLLPSSLLLKLIH